MRISGKDFLLALYLSYDKQAKLTKRQEQKIRKLMLQIETILK